MHVIPVWNHGSWARASPPGASRTWYLSPDGYRDQAAVITDELLAGHVGDSASVSGAGSDSQKRRMPESVISRSLAPPRKRNMGAGLLKVAGWPSRTELRPRWPDWVVIASCFLPFRGWYQLRDGFIFIFFLQCVYIFLSKTKSGIFKPDNLSVLNTIYYQHFPKVGYFLPNKQALIYQSIIKSYLAILYVASFKGNSCVCVSRYLCYRTHCGKCAVSAHLSIVSLTGLTDCCWRTLGSPVTLGSQPWVG